MHSNCKNIHEIWLSRAEGRRLTESEESAIKNHLANCDPCRRENAIVNGLLYDGQNTPAPELNELEQRRSIDKILEQAAVMERDAALSRYATSKDDAPVVRRRFAVGIAAAVLAAAAIAVFSFMPPVETIENRVHQKSSPVVAQASTLYHGRLLLTTGDIKLKNASLEDKEILENSKVTVSNGAAVIRLSTGVKLHIGKNSEVEFKKFDKSALSMNLTRGEVFAEVDPKRSGPPILFETPNGHIKVTGTVFSLEASDESSSVQVFRGSVDAVNQDGTARSVQTGQTYTFGGSKPSQIPKESISNADQKIKVLDLVTPSNAAILSIGSLPDGALIKVDGVEMGRTPFKSSIRSGSRQLEISKEGHQSVKELLQLSETEEISRVFELSVLLAKGDSAKQTPLKPDTQKIAPEKSSPTETVPWSANQLLEIAQTQRQARDWPAALEAYNNLASKYPSSALGRAALVSMGQIQLERIGKPEAALKSFERYLKTTSHGTLAQEAAFGKAQALRSLGRTDAEKAALTSFLQNFPGAIQTSRVKDRLNQLQ